MATYRKDRAVEIPIVFKEVNAGSSFWLVNPNKLANEIISLTQEKLLTQQINKDENLVVSVSSLTPANKLLAVTTLAGSAVSPSVPQ